MTNKRRDAIRRALPALLAACAVSLSGAACLDAYSHEVTDVRARQRWPWNNLVDIDYAISGATNQAGVAYSQEDALSAGLSLRFEFITAGGKTNAVALGGYPPVTNGSHRVTWNPAESGINMLVSPDVTCRAVLERHAPDTYLVIDLSGGKNATEYPASYLPMPPGGAWGDEYKTEKLVLRKIEPGTFTMSNPDHQVTLTKSFYIGVFEVTQRQYELVTGRTLGGYLGDCRATTCIEFDEANAQDFLRALVSRTGLPFTLPTEAQWEYACRAGTTTALNNGSVMTDLELAKLARYSATAHDGKGGGYTSGPTGVGAYLPNAWGLYDMHGNVWEWCSDWYTNDLGTAAVTDPAGPATGPNKTIRGGSWVDWSSRLNVAFRWYYTFGGIGHNQCVGFRAAVIPDEIP